MQTIIRSNDTVHSFSLIAQNSYHYNSCFSADCSKLCCVFPCVHTFFFPVLCTFHFSVMCVALFSRSNREQEIIRIQTFVSLRKNIRKTYFSKASIITWSWRSFLHSQRFMFSTKPLRNGSYQTWHVSAKVCWPLPLSTGTGERPPVTDHFIVLTHTFQSWPPYLGHVMTTYITLPYLLLWIIYTSVSDVKYKQGAPQIFRNPDARIQPPSKTALK